MTLLTFNNIVLLASWVIIAFLIYIIYSGIEPWRFITDDYQKTFMASPIDKRTTSVSEEFVREIFQNYFQKPFVKSRPSWLRGGTLELDGYNEELRIAFEYNGIQHYQFPNYYMKTYEEFQRQQANDQYKIEECKNNNVKLIVIPYSIKPAYIRRYVLDQLLLLPAPTRHNHLLLTSSN